MMTLWTLGALALLPALAYAASPLQLASLSQGTTFFDNWTVNGSATDPTQYGNIHYLNHTAAQAAGLISVNKAGHAILKVDNSTSDPAPGPYSTFGRDTVLIISNATIDIGTLVVLDAVHIPYGCSVWPAFWTLDSVTNTDEGGEIDIIEAVNLMENNQFSLHAKEGCTLAPNTSTPYSGTQIYTDCNYVFNVTGNRGCGIQETATPNSLGAGFAQNGGGVYAMYWSTSGIQMWFFGRNGIPQDLNSNAPDPTGWPRPSAYFPANGCDPRAFFNPQRMILNTNLCGAWAGNAQVYNSTGCSGSCVNMIGKASNFDNAYWEINYVKTFTAAGNATATATASGGAPGTATGSGTASTTGGGIATAGPANGARRLTAATWAACALLVAGVAAAFA